METSEQELWWRIRQQMILDTPWMQPWWWRSD